MTSRHREELEERQKRFEAESEEQLNEEKNRHSKVRTLYSEIVIFLLCDLLSTTCFLHNCIST